MSAWAEFGQLIDQINVNNAAPFREVVPKWKTNPIRAALNLISPIIGLINLPQDALNAGVAMVAPSGAWSNWPAATYLTTYLGVPHGHLHPPSLVPPSTVPLLMPSMGQVMIGNCYKVTINMLPAARAGDMGWAPTCGGITPFFKIVTGSSKVFIGGNRAARRGDLCVACTKGGESSRFTDVMRKIGVWMNIGAMGADVVDALGESDRALADAAVLSLEMNAMQMASEALLMATEKLMGLDPKVPPSPMDGALVSGSPNVMIGGCPLPSLPSPVEALLTARTKVAEWWKGRQNFGLQIVGDPVDVVSGACVDAFPDFDVPGVPGLAWHRHYRSDDHRADGPIGRGFRHHYQHELVLDIDGLSYRPPSGEPLSFPPLEVGQSASRCGYTLNRSGPGLFELAEYRGEVLEFEVRDASTPVLLRRIRKGERRLELRYDRASRLASISDGEGGMLALTYDDRHRVTQVRLQGVNTGERVMSSYEYNERGCLTAWRDSGGQKSTYTYDEDGRMICRTNRLGYAIRFEYDEQGRCIRSGGEDGLEEVHLEYHAAERCTQVRLSDGASWQYFYDENGTLVQRIDPYGGSLVRNPDTEGRISEEVDAEGRTTRRTYAECGAPLGRQGAIGMHSAEDVTGKGTAGSPGHLPETALEWEYGGLLEPGQIGLQLSDDPVTRHLSGLVGSLPITEAERAASTGEARRRFDVLGRLIEIHEDDGTIQRWRYDSEGNILERQDRDGAVYQYQYGRNGLRIRDIDPLGAVTSYAYSSRGRITRVIDAGGTSSEYEYDLKDRLVRVNRSGALREEYRYGAEQSLLEKRDAHGRDLLALAWTAGGAKRSERHGSGKEHQFEYDEQGRMLRLYNDEHDVRFEYDARGHRTRDEVNGRGVSHVFGESGLVSTEILGRFKAVYRRDEEGNLTIGDPGAVAHRFIFGRSGILGRLLPNGCIEVSRYLANGRCQFKQLTCNGALERRWSRRYRWSAEGDLIQVEDSERGARSYSYDGAHRLIYEGSLGDQVRRWSYDRAGNLLEQPGLSGVSIVEGNRLRYANGDTFEYDHRHHVASRSGSGGAITYSYDSKDMLIHVNTPAGEWSAGYDPIGRRMWKCWNGARTEFLWDSDRLAAELRPDGHLRLYLYVDAVALVPFMCIEYDEISAPPESGRRHYIFTDQVGSPLEVLDESGVAVWRATTDPYGHTTIEPGGGFEMPLRFPGHYHDSEIGLSYNRFRYYSPELGRYLQSDPLGIEGGLNLYAYPTSPLGRVDLRGLCPSTGPVAKAVVGEGGPDTEKVDGVLTLPAVPSGSGIAGPTESPAVPHQTASISA